MAMRSLPFLLIATLILVVFGAGNASANEYTADVVITENTGPSISGTLNNEGDFLEFGYLLEEIDWDYTSNMRISYFDVVVDWEANGGGGGGRQVTFEVSSENNTAGESQSDSGGGGTIVTTWEVNELPEVVNSTADSAEDFVQSYETPGEWMGGKFTYTSESVGSITSTESIDYTISLTYYTWNIENIIDNATLKYSVNFTEDVVNLDVSPGASGIGCTEMVISNLGTITIDVDVEFSGDNITISPGAVSVTLAPEGNITTPICALALTRSEARTHPVSVLASGRETNTQLNPVQVISNFTAIVDPYAKLSIQAPLPAKHCIGSTFWTNFTGVNNGNANNSVVFELTNIQELEDAGFTIRLPILQYQLEPASFQNMVIKIDSENVTEGYYNMIVTIATTMDDESFSASTTYTINVANCQEKDANIEDDSLPSISLIPALITIGIIAMRRRY